MRHTKALGSFLRIGLLSLVLTATLSGCILQDEDDNKENSKPTESSESYAEFPQVNITNKKINFDYYVTSTKIAESITDSVFQKQLKPKGRYLVVEFSGINKGSTEEYGNMPLIQLDYNGKTFDADLAASAAEEENIGLKAYTKEKVKPNRKGKYVKVFDLENYDVTVKESALKINLENGAATGSIKLTLPVIPGTEPVVEPVVEATTTPTDGAKTEKAPEPTTEKAAEVTPETKY